MDADGRNEHALVSSAGARFSPMWTPDAVHILSTDTLADGGAPSAVPVRDG